MLNAANEVAVQAFLDKKMPFLSIPEVVSYVMKIHEPKEVTLETVMAADQWGRKAARRYIENNVREVL